MRRTSENAEKATAQTKRLGPAESTPPMAPKPAPAPPADGQDIYKQLRKTKMCMNFLKGMCRHDQDCSYAHSEVELRERPNLRKTRLCRNFALGACALGSGCSFAHGGEELKRVTRPVVRTCAHWATGTCWAGATCRFAHEFLPTEDDVSSQVGGFALPDPAVLESLPCADASSAALHGLPPVPLSVMADLAALMARPASSAAPAPPPPPPRWKQESENLKPESSNKRANVHVSTPPKAPLLERMPLSPTAVNLLPAGLLSPGS
jgi:hypothetical protein